MTIKMFKLPKTEIDKDKDNFPEMLGIDWEKLLKVPKILSNCARNNTKGIAENTHLGMAQLVTEVEEALDGYSFRELCTAMVLDQISSAGMRMSKSINTPKIGVIDLADPNALNKVPPEIRGEVARLINDILDKDDE